MGIFQNELDVATIDLEDRFKLEIGHYFTATQYSCVCLDTFTNGLLSYQLSNILPKMSYLGCLSSSSSDIIKTFTGITAPISTSASSSFSLETAKSMAKKFNSQVCISLSGISSIPDSKNIITSKVFIAYMFNNNVSEKCVECFGTQSEVIRQTLHACLGYLKLLFIKYPIKKKEN
ncbi:hypothetical protein DID78_04100 [Candidatus Marinamargulisbacteria bacterium SCGC AG-343-D04]|nr:hypothetical protein DID78_04100 [Candidatus Marinamargulisbacteria bacterium SCGC AG-343-D04]